MIDICQICNELNEVEIYLATKMCTECRKDDKTDDRVSDSLMIEKNRLMISSNELFQYTDVPPKIINEEDLDAAGLEKFIKENQMQVDTTAKVREDIFNAKTTSIVQMEKEIEADDTIERKHFALSIRVTEVRNHLRKILFDVNEAYNKTRESINSEIRSQTQYLNNLANKLRTNERERIKSRDITYTPLPPKATRKPKVDKKKFDKKELKKYSDLLGGNMEYTLQMLCVANNMQPDKAYEMLKELQKND